MGFIWDALVLCLSSYFSKKIDFYCFLVIELVLKYHFDEIIQIFDEILHKELLESQYLCTQKSETKK